MKTKVKKTTAIVLIISLALCLVSMIGTSLMQSNFGQSQVTTTTASLKEIGKMIRANNSAYGKNIEVTFTENANAKISFMTIIPKNASTNNPVPAVVCSHGGSNTKEMQMINYTELARRGFVVVSIDMAGHGYSDQAIDAMTNNSLGMLAAVEYAMSLGCVDETRVGVTGHSTGNTACFGSISDLNVEGSSQRIAAFVEGAGTNVAPSMTSEYADGMIWTIAVCQYDEFDTVYFDSGHILTSNIAKSFLQKVYPEYDETAVPEGQWYTPDGPIAAPTPGDALAADTAVRMVNPPLTHPMFHFSLTGTQIVLDGFYAAFGVPSGGKYIATSNQTWPVMVVFELLGLIGFFMLLFPLVDLMLETRVFSSIRRSVPEQSNMPALSNPKEWVVLVITLVALIISSFFTYMRYYPRGSSLVNTAVFSARGTAGNGIAVWTFVCGIITLLVILANYFCRRIAYGKHGTELGNPFEPARMDSVTQFLKTLLFAFTVVVIMYLPVYVARYLFQADFRICSFVVMTGEPREFYTIIMNYLPMWVLFYVPNAILNANTRYKDIPDWLGTVICAVANCISLVIFLFIQYGTLFGTGYLWNPDCGMAGISAFAVFPCLAYAAFSARYIYNKTGNAWAAGLINAIIMCSITIIPNGNISDMIFPG